MRDINSISRENALAQTGATQYHAQSFNQGVGSCRRRKATVKKTKKSATSDSSLSKSLTYVIHYKKVNLTLSVRTIGDSPYIGLSNLFCEVA